MNTFDLALDLDKRAGVTQWVTLRQGDHNGTVLKATIYDHGVQVGGGYTCRVSIRIAGSGDEYYRETANYSNGVATVTIDEQYAAAVVGITYGYFELLQGSAVIASTESFGVRVLQSAQEGAVPGDKYDSAIEDALAELDEATGHISQMVVDATEEYLEAHPEITTTVQDNSLTDAKLVQKGGILSREQWLETMLPNIPRKTTAEADVHSVTDSAGGGPLGIEVYGRSTQDGTPTPDAPVGIQSVTPNLFGTPVQASITGNGPYSVNLGANGTVFFCEVKPSTTYTAVSFEGNKFRVFTSEVDPSGGGSVEMVSLANVDNPAFGYAFTFTTSATERYVAFTANTTSGGYDSDIKAAMFEGSGSNAFVPYGSIGLYAVARNLLPDYLGDRYPTTTTAYGVTLTNNGDGTFTLEGTSEGTHDSFSTTFRYALPAGRYVLSGCPAGGGSSTWRLHIRIARADGSRSYSGDAGGGAAFTLYEGDRIDRIYIYITDGAVLNNAVFAPQIEVGSVAHAYEPYSPVTIPIDLQGHVLRSLPDGTRDEVTVDERGHAVLVQRVGVTSWDALTWYTGSNVSVFYAAIADMRNGDSGAWPLLEDYAAHSAYQNLEAAAGNLPNKNAAMSYGASQPYIYVRDNDYTTHADYRAAGLDGAIHYPLAEPVTIDLGYLDPALLPAPDLTAYIVPSAPSVLRYGFDVAAALAEIATA